MDAETIRRKAEALLKDEYPEQKLSSDEDLHPILHELRVHQVELELQNDELRRIQEELQATQRKYFDLFNLAPVGYFSFNQQGHIVELNLTASQLLRYGRKYLVGKPLLSHLAAESRTVFFEHLDSVFNTNVRQQCELIIRSAENRGREAIIVRADSTAVNEDGTWLCRTTMTDISQQKALEMEMSKTQKLEAVGLLAGGIAHDFNNLLTGLFGNIELAKLFLSGDHKSYKYLESSMRSLESATNLTKQLLTFAKGGEPIKETLAIGRTITEMALFSLRGSNVKLQTTIDPDLWLVEVDKGQLSQVVSNLVINAHQSMPMGGVVVIAAENVEMSEGRYVKITIQDEGCGIAPKYLDKIFDPYFSTKQKGSGLGLAITHSIIHKHNGRITVDSQIDLGTRFTIYLPAAVASTSFAMGKRFDSKNTGPLSSAYILVLDDEEAVREVIGAMLQQLGHQVEFAIEGQEAILKYQAAWENGTPFQVAILDLTIPGYMGGQKAAEGILAIDSDAKLVVSSGYATDPVMANYKSYGFQARAVKPFSYLELQKAIEQVLDI